MTVRTLLAVVAVAAIAVMGYVLGVRSVRPDPVYLSGLVFHRAGCPVVGPDAVAISPAEAEELYWACSVCRPGP
jgi:hypothetical protein